MIFSSILPYSETFAVITATNNQCHNLIGHVLLRSTYLGSECNFSLVEIRLQNLVEAIVCAAGASIGNNVLAL